MKKKVTMAVVGTDTPTAMANEVAQLLDGCAGGQVGGRCVGATLV